jgi:ATP-dependent 26S proteasome regulatory subunit
MDLILRPASLSWRRPIVPKFSTRRCCAGHFDGQIIVDKPDLVDREAILRLHNRGMKLAEGIDLRVIAQRTAGMVGADLANIANEARSGLCATAIRR